jgi:hypothetical protein
MLRIGIIYKVTYPNGKIYIGQDRTDDINYFGSACSFDVRKDFSMEQYRNFTIRKEILERKRNITIQDLNRLERKYIQKFNSCDPAIGYNRTGYARRLAKTVWKYKEERRENNLYL